MADRLCRMLLVVVLCWPFGGLGGVAVAAPAADSGFGAGVSCCPLCVCEGCPCADEPERVPTEDRPEAPVPERGERDRGRGTEPSRPVVELGVRTAAVIGARSVSDGSVVPSARAGRGGDRLCVWRT